MALAVLLQLSVWLPVSLQCCLPFTSGTVALYCLAMQACCADPSLTPAPGLKGGKKALDLRKLLERKLKEEIENIVASTYNCSRTFQTVLEHVGFGSFENPMAASQVTPSLENRNYLGLNKLDCKEFKSERARTR
ncbi:UNVERIFIED_CONTAM: hypothetical protein FKN15_037246 [Acipenser sinensis]